LVVWINSMGSFPAWLGQHQNELMLSKFCGATPIKSVWSLANRRDVITCQVIDQTDRYPYIR